MKSKIKFRYHKSANQDLSDTVQKSQDFDFKKYLTSPDFRNEIQKIIKKESRKFERKLESKKSKGSM